MTQSQHETEEVGVKGRAGGAEPLAGVASRLDQLNQTAPKITAFIYSSQPTRVKARVVRQEDGEIRGHFWYQDN